MEQGEEEDWRDKGTRKFRALKALKSFEFFSEKKRELVESFEQRYDII